MHIHCLSSLIVENIPDQNGYSKPLCACRTADYKKYEFTRISIEYEDVPGGDSFQKKYYFSVYRPPYEAGGVDMKPGTIEIKNVDLKNFIVDLEIKGVNYYFSSETRLKSIRIRNIKNVTNLTTMIEDQKLYDAYVERVYEYQQQHSGCTIDDAFDSVKLESNVIEKTLKQTIRTMCQAIDDLCNPESSSSKVDRKNARYKSKKGFESQKSIKISNQKDYQRLKISNKRNWLNLEMHKIAIPRVEKEWFDAIYLSRLTLMDVEITDHSPEAWNAFANGISALNDLHMLQLGGQTMGTLKKLPDIFYEKLPTSLKRLDITKTNINYISPLISRLTDTSLILSDNPYLNDDGIPWEDIPKNIAYFYLSNTGVTKLPKSLERFEKLDRFDMKDAKLKSIAWSSLKNISEIKLGIDGNFNEESIANLTKLSKLTIDHASNKTINIAHFPPRITNFAFHHSPLETFIFSSHFACLCCGDLPQQYR